MTATMRTVRIEEVIEAVKGLCLQATSVLPSDVIQALMDGKIKETSGPGKEILEDLIANAKLAAKEKLPLCQDTGVAVYFVEMGVDVRLEGGLIYDALIEGTRQGYSAHYLRKSIVMDPVFNRKNTGDNTPPIMHVELVPGHQIKITLATKGGGAENMSALRMLKPFQGKQGIKDFIVETVVKSGGNACPPLIIGVGIGGNLEHSAYLAKKSLLRRVGDKHPDAQYAEFEKEILDQVNATGLGPSGLGGCVTALAVHILAHPCHIASLPVAVNLNCNSARHASATI